MTAFNSPSPATVLQSFTQKITFVDFNVKDPDHITAYIMLTKYGRQHPNLRFNLMKGYQDVHSMMNAMVGAEFVQQFPELDKVAATVVLHRERITNIENGKSLSNM